MTTKRGLRPMDDAMTQRWIAAFEKVGIKSYKPDTDDNDAFESGILCYGMRGDQIGLWVPIPVKNNIITRRWVWVRFSGSDIMAWALLDSAGVDYEITRWNEKRALRVAASDPAESWKTSFTSEIDPSLARLVLDCIEHDAIRCVDVGALASKLILE